MGCALQTRGGVNNAFSNLFGISRLLEKWITPDKLYGAILPLFSVPICFRGPEMFCGFWLFTCLSISTRGKEITTDFFYYWMNCSFKSSFHGASTIIPLYYKAVTYWLIVYLLHKQFTVCSYYFLGNWDTAYRELTHENNTPHWSLTNHIYIYWQWHSV